MTDAHQGGRRTAGRPKPSRRRMARLAAVQALYQIDLNGERPEAVLQQFERHRLGQTDEGMHLDADPRFFAGLIRGVVQRQPEIDGLLETAMAPAHHLARIEVVLRAILRAATYELVAMPDVPPRVVLAEYVDITGDFFSEREAGLANGVLDRVARGVRVADYGGGERGPGTTEQ
ncbi:MAG: transcription antitermination factor NusB [Alphaproteobacteria bacterium]